MKLWVHGAIVIAGGAIFHALASVWTEALGNFTPQWYHEPIVLPVRVAIWAGGNPHNLSAIAGNITWALECIVAGLIVDLLAVIAITRIRQKGVDTSGKKA